ncbi:hypothetical protein ARMGADRAFT_1021424 [Armillaria gallica]|uniref:Uncharacterized protein n=1 Tax=Armillaria gallica TaxID=47427 RepID=A0A2H3CTY6_ARMGA|nr:hypothetical protein ARMGADRAFT_1021424 [Armillaria gallica]
MTLHHPTMMCPEPTISLTRHRRLSLKAAFLVFLDSQVPQRQVSIRRPLGRIRGDDRDLQMTPSQQNVYQQHTTAKMEANTTDHVPVSTASGEAQ